MIAYYKCKCRSKDKLKIKELIDQGVEVRIVKGNPLWRAEAKQYGTKMPFLVKDGKVTAL